MWWLYALAWVLVICIAASLAVLTVGLRIAKNKAADHRINSASGDDEAWGDVPFIERDSDV